MITFQLTEFAKDLLKILGNYKFVTVRIEEQYALGPHTRTTYTLEKREDETPKTI